MTALALWTGYPVSATAMRRRRADRKRSTGPDNAGRQAHSRLALEPNALPIHNDVPDTGRHRGAQSGRRHRQPASSYPARGARRAGLRTGR